MPRSVLAYGIERLPRDDEDGVGAVDAEPQRVFLGGLAALREIYGWYGYGGAGEKAGSCAKGRDCGAGEKGRLLAQGEGSVPKVCRVDFAEGPKAGTVEAVKKSLTGG